MLGLSFPENIDFNIRNVFSDICSRVNGFFFKQHNPDGTHSAVTADSVTLAGALVGVPTDLKYDAARFDYLGGGAWTVESGDMKVLRATRVGQLVFVQFYLDGTTIVTDSPDELWIRLPEFHAIPALNVDHAAVDLCGGNLEWDDTTNMRQGTGTVAVAADDFSGPVPGTLLILRQYIAASSADRFYKQWDVTSDLQIKGSATFVLTSNNTPSPFFGA